jgi:hypothetical protein
MAPFLSQFARQLNFVSNSTCTASDRNQTLALLTYMFPYTSRVYLFVYVQYGFRKLRTDPILTQDVDPRTSAYIRFYHDKFQKDKPDLLQHIRRATKTDQQSRDDLDYLKQEICKLQETNADMKQDFDQRLAQLSYECNRRVTALNADYDKLYSLVQTFISNSNGSSNAAAAAAAAAVANGHGMQYQQQHHHPIVAAPAPGPPRSAPPPSQHGDATAVALAALRDLPTSRRTVMPNLLHSLSHAAAAKLQNVVREEVASSPSQQHQQQQNNGNMVTESSSGSSSNGSATRAQGCAGYLEV